MAAAEYYSNVPMGPTQQPSPYQRPQYAQTNSHISQPSQPPPPYHAIQQEQRPTVHFADRPQRPQRHSFSSQAPIPVLVEQQHQQHQLATQRPYHSPQLPPTKPQVPYQPQMSQSPRPSVSFSPQMNAVNPHGHQVGYPQPDYSERTQVPPRNPQLLSPYMQQNQSQYSLNGYASDPEPHRRRRRRHSNDNKDGKRPDREPRSEKTRKQRSRSTNADGFLGAAGGGLIGDLIFPGLGTVGGAVAGWIGGKDYGKHRKSRESQLDRDQEKWEHRFHRHGDERPQYHRSDREQRSYERHKYDH